MQNVRFGRTRPLAAWLANLCDSRAEPRTELPLDLAEIWHLAKTRLRSYNISTEFILRPVASSGGSDGPKSGDLLP